MYAALPFAYLSAPFLSVELYILVEKTMPSSDDNDSDNEIEEIRHFFSPEECKEMSTYEKGSFARAARNHKANDKIG